MNNSNIGYRRNKKIIESLDQGPTKENFEKLKILTIENMELFRTAQQSSKLMWYYNYSQITRMKIDKNQFKMEKTEIDAPE